MAVVINGTTGIDKVQDGSIQTADLAANAVTAAKLNVGQIGGRRNLVINGAMQVAQRGTSVTGISSSNGYQTVDRMFIRNSGAGTYTNSQSTDSPGYGFKRSIDFSCTTADSLSAGDFAYLGYRFEGYDAVRTMKGETGAGDITLSFWVKSSETGTAVVGFSDSDNSRLQNRQYTVNAADTWEKKTITISVIDGSNKFNNDNEQSFQLFFWLAAGTDRTSGSLQTSWASPTAANEAAGQTINAVATTSSYIRFTGLQLEVGDTATPFEHRSYGEELQLCQRYFYRIAGGANKRVALSGNTSGNFAYPTTVFPTTMRTGPSMSNSGASTFKVEALSNSAQQTCTSVSANKSEPDVYTFQAGAGAQSGGANLQGNAAFWVNFDAEL